MASHALARAIERNKEKEAEYRSYGVIIIDARQPISNVIDKILSSTASG